MKNWTNFPFFRSHKSFLINLDYIEIIEPWFNSTFNVILKHSNMKIPVSRSQSKEFKKIDEYKIILCISSSYYAFHPGFYTSYS